jgi:hypothetical protein
MIAKNNPGGPHGILHSPVDEFDVAAFLDDEFAMGVLGNRSKSGRVVKPRVTKSSKAMSSPVDGSSHLHGSMPSHLPLFIPTHAQNGSFVAFPPLQLPSMLSMGLSFPGMLNSTQSPIPSDPAMLHHSLPLPHQHHQSSNEHYEKLHPDYSDVAGMGFDASEKIEDDHQNPLKKSLSILHHHNSDGIPNPPEFTESEPPYPYHLSGIEGHASEGIPADVFSQHMDSSFHPVPSSVSFSQSSKKGKAGKPKEHVSRRRSAPREHLHLVGQYCESGPWSRIRVWKNDRNQIFYDCLCGKRVPIQHLKKIKHHAESHDVNQYVCDTCGREFDHYLKRNAHQKTHKKGGGDDGMLGGSEISSTPSTPATPATLHHPLHHQVSGMMHPLDRHMHGTSSSSSNPSEQLPQFTLSGVHHQSSWM